MNNPKKILIFSVVYYPKFVGGAEVAVKEITDRLNKDEYEFHLISLLLYKKLPKEEKIGNVFVYRVGFGGEVEDTADSMKFPLHYNKYLYPFLAAWYGLKLAKKHDFNLTWAIMANYSGFGALFFKLLKPKIPFLLTLQEGDPIDYIKKRVMLVYPLFKMIFKKADSLQAISNYLAKFGKDMGFPGEPKVVPNGVDVKNFQFPILNFQERQKIREELGLKGEDVALVTTSRLVIKNGVGDVINALPNLAPNIKFVIFGEGYLKEKLELETRNSKLETRVFFRGFVDHKDMPRYLKACDIFIRPSLSEGFGNSFIEAMACKIPVIATPVGGIVDFLFDQRTGYFCEPENPDSIAEVVQKVIVDPNKNQVVENAYQMVVKKYDWDIVAVQMKEIFGSI